MDQPVPMRQPLSALAEAAAARLELAVVEEIGPLAVLESIVEEIRSAVGMQAAAARLELVVVEEIGPLAALESIVVEEIRPAEGMQPCLV
jgi:nucleoside-triphosphatase THEP1